MEFCACETPLINVEVDAGCRRCGLPVQFSTATPPAGPRYQKCHCLMPFINVETDERCRRCGLPVVLVPQAPESDPRSDGTCGICFPEQDDPDAPCLVCGACGGHDPDCMLAEPSDSLARTAPRLSR